MSRPRTVEAREFYAREIVLSTDAKFELCTATQFQNCNTWKKERSKRITGTKAHGIIAAFNRNAPDSKILELFQQSQSKSFLPAIKYGIENEGPAR